MAAIKRTPADAAFSDCIRAAANWSCERCGKYYPEGSRMGLHCSHHHGRGNWGIRFDPLNAECLCYGCHSHVGGTQQRREEVLTDQEQELLFEKMRDRNLAKEAKKTKGKGEIAKHFRDEFDRIERLRAEGIRGKILIIGYF